MPIVWNDLLSKRRLVQPSYSSVFGERVPEVWSKVSSVAPNARKPPKQERRPGTGRGWCQEGRRPPRAGKPGKDWCPEGEGKHSAPTMLSKVRE